MDLFDSITDSKEFYKFNQMLNPGWAKDAKQKSMTIWIENKDQRGSILTFFECLNPPSTDLKTQVRIYLEDDLQETEIGDAKYTDPVVNHIYITIPLSFDDRKIVSESKKVIKEWIEGIDFKDTISTNFFKWWMENYIFKQEKYSNFLKSFESAFVEWMRAVTPKEAGEAYLKIINNSKDPSIKRRVTELETKDIIDHIKQGIIEFDIKIEKVVKGRDFLKRFDVS